MVSDATRAWFAGLVDETQRRFGALAGLQDDPQRFYGRAALRDGVSAVTAPGGALVDLALTPASLRLAPEELSALILRAQRQATAEANRAYAAAVQDATGGSVDVSALVEHRLDAVSMREAADDLDRSRNDLG